MTIVGEAVAVLDLVVGGWRRLRQRSDPAYVQAERLINAFEAYGIARQQIARILPAHLEVPSPAFSSSRSLREQVTPALLDWAHNYLNLSRRWFDGVSALPHMYVDGYKRESIYEDWLRHRIEAQPNRPRALQVWTSEALERGWENRPGYLTIVYTEVRTSVDTRELSLYWLLSREWPTNHAPCVESMLKVVQIARSMRIGVSGRLLSHQALRNLERGRTLAPHTARGVGRLWHPEDLANLGA